jgi:allophanate hydrolase
VSIEVEIYSLKIEKFGRFIAKYVPKPLCIGNIILENGSVVKGFLCENVEVITNSSSSLSSSIVQDISEFGGWRNFMDGLGKV